MRRQSFASTAIALLLSVWYSTTLAAEVISVESAPSQAQSVLGSSVIPYREVTLAAQIPGVVKFLGGDVGASFQSGAVLAQVDEAQLVAKRNAVLAQIQTAQAALQNSEAQYRREIISPRSKDVGAMPGMGLPSLMDNMFTRPMADALMNNYDSDMGRYSDLMASATGVSQARSSLQQAYSQLQEIDAALQNAKSVAPFEGIIMEKLVEVGDTVQPGQPLMRFGFVKYKRLQADVPSGLVSYLKEGMVVPARIDGDLDVVAKVTQIYPVANPERHTVTVKFDLPIDISAAPGMYAEVRLPSSSGDTNRVVIPRSALLTGRSLPSVLVVEDNTSQLRLVRLGTELGDNKVEVVSGLKPGARIINNPPASAVSGWMPTATN
ncbi:efflux RND transporter periplasmic adaptor subunit [Thiolinea disciformis]|uniref:efflux RND transporter periplasmic adaptor subunit n=1 Tax=Thiolinea disciformis TaxID=125614 RepID=UPI000365A7D0|nr:efflux RND transporter periplasmic adaptor subunit [Thiolinea disciformis]